MRWSDEADSFLIKNRGVMSAALIADKLKCSRNAVLGRAHRLGLQRLDRNNPANAKPRRGSICRLPATVRVMKVKVPDAPPIIDAQIPFEQRKQLLDLGPTDCRWPVGDPGTPGFFFCGGPTSSEQAYCAAHHKRAHEYYKPKGTGFQFRRAA